MRRTPLLVVVLGLLLAACGADDVPLTTGSGGTTTPGSTPETTIFEPIPEGIDGLEPARERWDAAGITSYTMTYREICFCPETVVTVVVRDGDVVDTTVEQDPSLGRPIDGLTVDDLFDELRQAVDGDAAEIQVTWDEVTGRPTRYWIDLEEMMADEEHGIEVSDLVVDDETSTTTPGDPVTGEGTESFVTTGTSQPPAVRAVAQAQLTEPWSCGWGFAAVDPSRTVALVLRAEQPSPLGASTVTLPASGWAGDVLLGSDLLSVDCVDQDLARPGEPAEAWPVVGGTLQVNVAATDVGECTPEGSPTPATAIATGLTVEAPDGARITFPELSLVNDQWGCFAG